jgi:hemoglobin
MDTLPQARVIRAMHPADLEPVKEVLKRYFTEWLGGPPLYSEERGHPRLRRRHMPFSIGAAERDAWMLCMTRALDSVSDDATLKHTLTQAFFRTADFIRTH